MKGEIKRVLVNACYFLHLYPSVWALGNPFKIYEFRKLVEKIRFHPNDVVLDLGCGKGTQAQIIARKVKSVIGIEVDDRQVQSGLDLLKYSCVKKKVTFILSTLEKADLHADSIDKVVSVCVLEHVPNLDEVLHEVRRILKPGGEVHITVDSLGNIRDAALIAKHRKDHSVCRYFSLESIQDTLQSAGFKIREAVPILRSEFARINFEERIAARYWGKGFVDSIGFVRELERHEANGSAGPGIMILARAVKPS